MFKQRLNLRLECWLELYCKNLRDRHGWEFCQNFNFPGILSTLKYHRTCTFFSNFYYVRHCRFFQPSDNTKTDASILVHWRGPKLLLAEEKKLAKSVNLSRLAYLYELGMFSNSHVPACLDVCRKWLVLLLKFYDIPSATRKVYNTSQRSNNSIELFGWHLVPQC